MLRIPLTELLSASDCYQYLLDLPDPDGLDCLYGDALAPENAPYKHESGGVVCQRYYQCPAIVDLFSATLFSGTHYSCRILVLLLRGGLYPVQRVHPTPSN